MAKEVLYSHFDTEASFVPVHFEESNPSFHTASVRIMAIDKVANNISFNQDSTYNALPTLKNIPIVTLFKKDEQNFGDHEMTSDVNGVHYGTYPIGVIPESANQWIEEVHNNETGQIDRYVCSDVLLWKRMRDEFSLIKSQGTFSVSMEVGMKDYEFNSNNICEVKDFYFTGIAVLGNGVKPAFKNACVNFTAQSDFQEMMFELKEYMNKFEGGESMPTVDPTNTFEEEAQVAEPTEPQEPQQTEDTQVEPQQEEPKEDDKVVKELQEQIESLKKQLEKAEADNGRLIAEVTKEKDDLAQELASLKESHETEVKSLTDELNDLRSYRKTTEAEIRKSARKAVQDNLINSFPELAEVEDYQKLLENEELSAQDLEDKAYALVGRLEREKRDSKRVKPTQTPPTTRVPLTSPTNKNKKANSPYGGLLIK